MRMRGRDLRCPSLVAWRTSRSGGVPRSCRSRCAAAGGKANLFGCVRRASSVTHWDARRTLSSNGACGQTGCMPPSPNLAFDARANTWLLPPSLARPCEISLDDDWVPRAYRGLLDSARPKRGFFAYTSMSDADLYRPFELDAVVLRLTTSSDGRVHVSTQTGVHLGTFWDDLHTIVAAFHEVMPTGAVGARAWVRSPNGWSEDIVASVAPMDFLWSAMSRWLRARGRRLTLRPYGAPIIAPYTSRAGDSEAENAVLAQISADAARRKVLIKMAELGLDPRMPDDSGFTSEQEYRESMVRGRFRAHSAAEGYVSRLESYGFEPLGVEIFDPAQVFSRDGWLCGICGHPVNRALKFPDPGSASGTAPYGELVEDSRKASKHRH